jgi:hypothetical protein
VQIEDGRVVLPINHVMCHLKVGCRGWSAILMAKPYSKELREAIVWAVANGCTHYGAYIADYADDVSRPALLDIAASHARTCLQGRPSRGRLKP